MIYHFIDGRFVTENEASISPFDLGFLRGYGVFDYVQIYQGYPFHLQDHLDRLVWSAAQLGIPLPKDMGEIESIINELIEKNSHINAGIRLLITGGISGQDYLLAAGDSSLSLLFHPFTPYADWYYLEGMRAVTFFSDRNYPCVKTTNYIHAVLAMKKAKEGLAHDAVYVNDSQELLEGTTSNLFFIKDGKLITARNDQVVNGVTRSVLLKLVKDHYPVEFRALNVDELDSCQEAFLTSSVKDVIPLVKIDDKKIGNGVPGVHTERIRSLFHQYLSDYLESEKQFKKKADLAVCS